MSSILVFPSIYPIEAQNALFVTKSTTITGPFEYPKVYAMTREGIAGA